MGWQSLRFPWWLRHREPSPADIKTRFFRFLVLISITVMCFFTQTDEVLIVDNLSSNVKNPPHSGWIFTLAESLKVNLNFL